MTSFFKSMNLARAIILLAALGCLGLGWLCWKYDRDLREAKDQYARQIEPLAKDLMAVAHEHTALSRAKKDEKLAGQADLETYIRSVALKDRIEIGDVSLRPSNDPRTKGVVDKKYAIQSSDKDRDYPRLKIANFLYTLESDSQRVKVTEITMETSDKRLKPHEIPDDKWQFKAEVTSRQRVE